MISRAMNRQQISLVLLSLFMGALMRVDAQTISAASCNASDVQKAFNAVTSSTTTVSIPAGTCTWTTQVSLSVPSGNTSLSVLGAGSLSTTGGGDQTVIIDNYASNSALLSIVTSSTSASYFRLAGITFEGGNGSVKNQGLINIGGSSANIRVDHVHTNTATYNPAVASSGMQFTGCTYGVVDHSIIDAPSGSVNNGIREYNAGGCFGDSLGVGDQAWANSTSFGSANFLYVENNVFNNGATNDCLFGGRFVERFNTFNMTGPPPSVQTHPTGSAGRIRGCRAQEVYQNAFNAASGNYLNAAIWINSGTALVWGNTIPSSSAGGATGYQNFIELLSTRQNSATYGQTAAPNGWGYCGTAFNGAGSNWDQNSSASAGYHCMDDAGRGQGDLLTGGFTSDGSGSNNVTNTATNCASSSACAYPRQASEPIYEWIDNYSLVPSNPSHLLADSEPTAHLNNVDYYLWCNASSQSGCTSFNGTAGVGSGTLAARPSTCTTGVAYWATDQGNWNASGSGGQGELFVCSSTNSWTLFYTPYAYPHPLDTTQAGPTPPGNVQAAP